MSMHENFCDFVNKNLDSLTSKTSDLSQLLTLLVQNKVISDDEKEDIKTNIGGNNQNEKLWEILKNKGDGAVPTILKCLEGTSCDKSVPLLLQQYLSSKNSILRVQSSDEIVTRRVSWIDGSNSSEDEKGRSRRVLPKEGIIRPKIEENDSSCRCSIV